jgi:holliday junction DNA helicase RuvA
MYAGFRGMLVSCKRNPVTQDPFFALEVNGCIYEMRCTDRFHQSLKVLGSHDVALMVHSHLHVAEGEMSLIAFEHAEERDVFRILLGASGVGVKVALAVLNQFRPQELITHVLNEDVKAITAIKGIGPKVAKRLILDVQEKLKQMATHGLASSSVGKSTTSPPAYQQALSESLAVLESLGYEEAEIAEALSKLQEQHTVEALATFDAEQLLRALLKTV